jgi:hypothetical protein
VEKRAEGLTGGKAAPVRWSIDDVGEVLGITAMCGSPSGMVGVGRSMCAGRDARRRRGIRPTHYAIVQSNGSESFTGC